jgi:hypothetical protein
MLAAKDSSAPRTKMSNPPRGVSVAKDPHRLARCLSARGDLSARRSSKSLSIGDAELINV